MRILEREIHLLEGWVLCFELGFFESTATSRKDCQLLSIVSYTSCVYRTFLLFLKTKDYGHDFKTAEPLLHGQRVDGGVEFAIKNIA